MTTSGEPKRYDDDLIDYGDITPGSPIVPEVAAMEEDLPGVVKVFIYAISGLLLTGIVFAFLAFLIAVAFRFLAWGGIL